MPFVRRHRDYYKYGTEPNASIVGSFARIDKGVASGFSSANYLTLSEVFNPQSNTWEQVWSVTTGANTSTTYQEILAQSNVGTAAVSGYDLRVNAGKITLFVEGTAFTGTTVLQDYTHYLIKAQYTGSTYILSYSTDNGASWVEDCNVASTVTGVPDMNVSQYVGIWKSTYNSSPSEQWLGTIDLSKSYIKINNEVWWSGDSYTKAGSWIDDGVVSGFSTSQYLTLPEVFNPLGSEFEAVFKVNLNTLADNPLLSQNASVQFPRIYLDINSTGNILFWIGNNSSWLVKLTSNVILETSKDYWIKFVYNNGVYYIYYSLDGKEYILDNSLESTNTILELTAAATIGFTNDSQTGKKYFRGSIDLTQSYIKINNKDWWHGTKAVESTEDDYDYHVDKNKLYQLAAVKRSYYKDGVVIPESSITDFGSTKYYKNVVTTKYWKEVTTGSRELGYGCYQHNNGFGYDYWYAKVPLTLDNNKYLYSKGGSTIMPGLATDSSEIAETAMVWQSLNETQGVCGGGKYNRYPEGDLYIDTTTTTVVEGTPEDYTYTTEEITTVEVSADDDYDFTEFVPSAEFDYYTDKLLSYSPIVRGERSYYKQDLSQRDTGTYTFILDKAYTAKMLFVGNGGGGSSSQRSSRWYYTGGGSGACFEGMVNLPADTYTLTIGTLGYSYNIDNVAGHSNGAQSTDSYLTNSNGDELIRVGAGKMGTGTSSGGAGGVITLGTLDVTEVIKEANGNTGGGTSSTNFALSAYDDTRTGYGAGTGSTRGAGNVYGIKGIFDLVLETDITDYDWYEDVGTKVY